jgi:hypothetical protein
MIETIRESLGFKVPVLWYASVDEADKAAGRVGAVLDECNLNLTYRGTNVEARQRICDVVEKASKIARKTKPVLKDGKPLVKDGEAVTEYDETEQVYVDRAMATAKLTVEALQAEVTKACKGGFKEEDGEEVKPLAVDIKERERKPTAPKKLADSFLEGAKKLLADATKLAAFGKAYTSLLKKPLASTTDPVAIGWALKELIAARQAAEMAKITG